VDVDFHCKRCGNCCRHAGEVRLEEGEAEAIAVLLGMDVVSFTATYTRLRDDRRGLSLTEKPGGNCVFLSGNAPFECGIQAAKPKQCRDFPFGWRYEDFEAICAAAPPDGISAAC